MRRSKRKKERNVWLKRVKDLYAANYYFLISLSIIFIITFLATVLGFLDKSMFNRFDINSIDSLSHLDYEAFLYDEDLEYPYVLIEAEYVEDEDLVSLQRALKANQRVSADAYWVSDKDIFNEDFVFHTDGLLKQSKIIDTSNYEVITFEELYVSENDISAVTEWDISDGRFEDDTYVVEGIIDSDNSKMGKISQLSALVDMIIDINEDNNELDHEKIQLEFIDGNNKILYHSGHKDILGQASLYASTTK